MAKKDEDSRTEYRRAGSQYVPDHRTSGRASVEQEMTTLDESVDLDGICIATRLLEIEVPPKDKWEMVAVIWSADLACWGYVYIDRPSCVKLTDLAGQSHHGLWDADPNCQHNVVALWSGVKCTKCPGWYCL